MTTTGFFQRFLMTLFGKQTGRLGYAAAARRGNGVMTVSLIDEGCVEEVSRILEGLRRRR